MGQRASKQLVAPPARSRKRSRRMPCAHAARLGGGRPSFPSDADSTPVRSLLRPAATPTSYSVNATTTGTITRWDHQSWHGGSDGGRPTGEVSELTLTPTPTPTPLPAPAGQSRERGATRGPTRCSSSLSHVPTWGARARRPRPQLAPPPPRSLPASMCGGRSAYPVRPDVGR